MAKVSIQFVRCCSPYNEGDKAGFTGPIADKYVRTGVARYVTTAVTASPVTKEALSSEPVDSEPSPPSPPAEEKRPKKKAAKKKKRARILKKDS